MIKILLPLLLKECDKTHTKPLLQTKGVKKNNIYVARFHSRTTSAKTLVLDKPVVTHQATHALYRHHYSGSEAMTVSPLVLMTSVSSSL